MEQRSADGLYPLAERFLAGEKVTWFESDPKPQEFLPTYALTAAGGRSKIKAEQSSNAENFYAGAAPGSIAVIPINGTIMKDDNCGSPGTDTLSSWIQAAIASPNIIGILQHVNSGGGTVEGTAEYVAMVEWASQIKPVETFTDGTLCSAAYWIAAPTRITASSGTVEIGSIGTAGSWKDYSPSNAGRVNSHYVTADESFDKNSDVAQVMKGNYQPIKDSIINPTQAIFKQSVIANRGDNLKIEDVKDADGNIIGQTPLTGKTYLAQPAMDLGLIDAIGNMDTVIQSITTRANSAEFAQTSNSNMGLKDLFGSKFQKLNALSGKAKADITDADIVAANEDLEAAGIDNAVIISAAHFEEAATSATAVDNGLTTLNAATAGKHTTLDAAITALVADRDKHKADAEKFGNQPGTKPSNPKTAAEAEGIDPNAKKFEDMNSLEQKAYKRDQLKAKKAKMNFNLEDQE